jgi:hypothetical protein
LSAKENQGRLAVDRHSLRHIFDDEQDLFLREWEKMRYQNEFKERVYSIAAETGSRRIRRRFGSVFHCHHPQHAAKRILKGYEHSKLLQFGQRSPQYRVWLGMGVGNTMLEAAPGRHGLNHSIADRSGTIVFGGK